MGSLLMAWACHVNVRPPWCSAAERPSVSAGAYKVCELDMHATCMRVRGGGTMHQAATCTLCVCSADFFDELTEESLSPCAGATSSR